MLSRQDRRYIILTYGISFLFLIVACAAAYKMVYKPARNELRHLHQTLSDQTPNSIEQKPAAQLGMYDAWVQSLYVSQSGLRRQITQMIQQASVRLIELRFDAKKPAASLTALPVLLKVDGLFPQMMRLFTKMANSHLVFNFKKLQLQKKGEKLMASMQLQFWII